MNAAMRCQACSSVLVEKKFRKLKTVITVNILNELNCMKNKELTEVKAVMPSLEGLPQEVIEYVRGLLAENA